MVCGDFNARTGGLFDYIQNDHTKDNFENCPLPIDYIPDIPLNRNQLDSKSNLHGTLLTNICKSCQMRIVNGRFLGDSLGYYTFFNANGKSTVDYMIVSQDLFYSVISFMVNAPSYISDHCMIEINLSGYTTNLETKMADKDLKPIEGSFKWSEQNDDLYVDSLLDQKGISEILSLNSLLDDDKFDDIDLLVEKTNDIYISKQQKTL